MADAESTTDDENEIEPLTPPQWHAFETSVAELLSKLDPGADVEHNVSEPGKVSGTPRQVDVLVSGVLAGSTITMAVECKNYKRPLGIGKVDEFAGKLIDLGVDLGVLYTLSGVTGPAARAQHAFQPRIVLRQMDPAQPEAPEWSEGLREFTGFGDCPNDNCYTGDIGWCDWPQDDGATVAAGSCDTCGTWAVRCPLCESETGFYIDETQCEGCERRYELIPDRKGGEIIDVVTS
jgi:hypothetical protein